MLLQRFHFELFADYFQFYVQDDSIGGDLSDGGWSQDAVDRLLAVGDGTIAVGIVRNMMVPVDIEPHDAPPQQHFEEWDHVNECSIEVRTGRLVVAGCTDCFAEAARIAVECGTYRARIFYGSLSTLSEDGLDGDDHCLVQLWPAVPSPLVVLKRRALT